MRLRTLALAVVAALPLVVAGPWPVEASAAAAVDIRNNEFAPAAVEIDPGGIVTWTLREGRHTVTAEDGSFRFAGLATGETASFTFPDVGTFRYFCELHGAFGGYPNGMTGVVYVGVEPPEEVPETRTVPSSAYPDIEAALDDLPAGSTVLVKPGVYPLARELQIESARVTLQPSREGTVVLEPAAGGDANVGMVVAADRVTVRGITVRGFEEIGVAVDARRATLDDVVVTASDRVAVKHGIRVLPWGSADINRPRVTGATVAGISVSGCRPRDTSTVCAYVSEGTVFGPGAGVSVSGAGAVTVARMELDVGGTGVASASSSGGLVAENRITTRGRGVSVTGGATNVDVLGNVLLQSAVGLHWDGVGVDVCFRRNTDGSGRAASSDPPLLQQAPCSSDVWDAL